MDHYGFWSLLPPVAAIFLAIKTRQVFISLFFGIWMGWIILSEGHFIDGTINTIQALVDVFKDAGNTFNSKLNQSGLPAAGAAGVAPDLQPASSSVATRRRTAAYRVMIETATRVFYWSVMSRA